MFKTLPTVRTLGILLILAGRVWAGDAAALDRTGLDRYVAAPDPSYAWKLVSTARGPGCTVFVVDMVSQTWRSESEVDRTRWQHWMTIVKPDAVKSDTGFLLINGGANGKPAPTDADPFLVELATGTGSVVSDIRMVPNQPLTFIGDDDRPRTEDDLIAHTWIKFLKGGDEMWPARNPMTKAAVRAMDTVTALMAGKEGGATPVRKFVVAGGSKRGWTTWTTAAVDARVIAIVPLVIDVLNADLSMRHHFAAYGFWAPSIGDYVRNGVMGWIGTPQHDALMALEDPYSYRRRYTMPKYIINATGDEFFLPDSSQFYFDGLPGEKHLRYVPNTNHSLKDSDARQSIYCFYESVLQGTKRPEFSWTFEPDGSIRVQAAAVKPAKVELWQATNAAARDFRVDTIGRSYQATPLAEQGRGVYIGAAPAPQAGWTAYFVELTFPSGGRYPFKFTTPVRITPDTLPYKDKTPDK